MRLPRSISFFLLSSLAAPGCFSLHRAERLLAQKDPKAALEELDDRQLKTNAREASLIEAEAALQVSQGARAKKAAQRALTKEIEDGGEGSAEVLFALAEAELLLGDALSASSLTEQAIQQKKSPPHRLVSRWLRLGPRQARALLSAGKTDEAMHVLGAVLAVAPTAIPLTLYGQVLLTRAQEREQRREKLAALEDYQTAAPLLPPKEAAAAWLAAGSLLLQERRVDEAKVAFDKCIEASQGLVGDPIQKRSFIAKLYSDWGEPGHAAELYREIAIQNKTPYYWSLAGEYFFAAGRIEDAEDAFEQSISSESDKSRAARDIANLFKKKGNLRLWEMYSQKAIAFAPTRFQERGAICDVWFVQGQLDRVKAEFELYIEEVKKASGDLSRAHTEIAQWYGRKKQDELAVNAYESARKAGAKASVELALTYGRLQRVAEMRAVFEEHLKNVGNDRGSKLTVARHLSNEGDVATAITLVKGIFAENPAQKDAAILLAELYIKDGDFAAEEKTLSAYAAASKDPAAAWIEVGQRYLKRSDKARAERAFTAAAGKNSRHALLQLGSLYLSMGEKAKAQKVFQQYIDTAPELYQALNDVLGYYPATEYDERAKLIAKLTALKPKNGYPLFTLGRDSLRLGNLSAAEKAFEGYVAASADQAQAYRAVAEEYQRASYPSIAEELFEKALEAYPSKDEGLYHKGELSLELGRWEQAISYFELYMSGSPNARILYQIGEKLRAQGSCDKASPFFARSLEIEPIQSDTTLSLGKCALQAGDIEKAAAVFDKIPKTAWGFLEVGRAYREFGYDALAIPHLQKALFSNPNIADTNIEPIELVELVLVLKAAGETERFQGIAKELLALCPRTEGCFGIYMGLAKAYRELDQPLLRLSHLEKASSLRPGTNSSTQIYEQIAETLVGLGEYRRAQDYYQKAANLALDAGTALFSYAERAQNASALGLAQRLFTLSAEHPHRKQPEAQISAASLLYTLGERKEALAALQQIATLDNTSEGWERIGMKLLQLKESAAGIEALQEAISLAGGASSLSIELARLLFASGERKHAIFILQNYLETNPSPKEQLEAASLFTELGEEASALQLYKKILSAQSPPEASVAFQNACALLTQRGELASLDEWIDAFLTSGVEQPKALVEVARSLARAKRAEQAAEFFLLAARVNTAESAAQDIFTGLVLLGKTDAAVESIQRFAYQRPNTALILARAAERAPVELASLLLDEALQLEPSKFELWERRAELFAANQSPVEASVDFMQALQLSTSPSVYAKKIITTLYENGAANEAESFLRYIQEPAQQASLSAMIKAGQKKDPTQDLKKFVAMGAPRGAATGAAKMALIGGWTNTTKTLLQESDLPLSTEALSLWLDASLLQENYDISALIERATKNANTFSERQLIVQHLLQRGEAPSVLSLARTLRSERPWELKTLQLFVRALAAVAPSTWESEALSAAQQYITAQSLEPQRATLNAVELLWSVGALSASQTIYESAVASYPDNELILLLSGKSKLAFGEIEPARSLFERAIAASSAPSVVWVSIGDAYRDVGAYDLAEDAYQSANHHGNQTKELWLKLAEVRLLMNHRSGAQDALAEAAARSNSPEQTYSSFAASLKERYGEDLSLEIEAVTSKPKARETPTKTTTPTNTLKLLWEPRSNLWESAVSQWESAPSQQQLLSIWSGELCAVNESFAGKCYSIIKNNASHYLLSIAAADIAQREGSAPLAELSLRLSPLSGAKAYQALIIDALQRGDKTKASQLAIEWRSVAIASDVETKRALFFFALTSSQPALRRAALQDAPTDLHNLAKKFSTPGTFSAEK